MQESSIPKLIKEKCTNPTSQGACCKNENMFSARNKKKTPTNRRPTWIQQRKKLLIQWQAVRVTKYAWFAHQKIWSGSTRHNRIHICSFESRTWTLHVRIKKGEQSLFDADSICYRNSCGTEQSIHHIYTNFQNCKRHMGKHLKMVPGFLETVYFRVVHEVFPPNDCCENEKICNALDNDQRLKN